MANMGLTKATRPELINYSGGGQFTATAGEVIKLERTGVEYIEYTVPAGETWAVDYRMSVKVI